MGAALGKGGGEGGPPGQVVSRPVAGSVVETPRLTEGAEPGLEYAPLDEDDGPVDCDCPAACYRGHRGYRSAPPAVGGGGALGTVPPLPLHRRSPRFSPRTKHWSSSSVSPPPKKKKKKKGGHRRSR